ncbi:MAG: diguanylate cyclase (GGDEF)-like protein, partial [Flavobacteriales bacterium]
KHIHLLDEGIRVDELAGISRAVNQLLISAKKRIIVEQQIAQKTQHLTNNFRMIFELSKNALAVTDERLRLESSNPRFAELVSHLHNVDTLIGSDKWLECTADDAESLRQTMLSSTVLNTPVTTEIELTAKLDTEIVHSFYNLTFIKAADDYGGLTILVFISDITEHHRKLLESEYEANHDGLTKLLNRAAATKKIRYLLSSDDEERFDVAIVMIDLDGFKSINDELGHDAGDAILRSVSRRISRVVSNVDVVCRWGGDEFLVALRGLGMAEASAKSNAILSEIQRPVKIMDGVERSVGASIGLSLSSESVRDFGSLFDQADKAMYQIKKSGKASVLVYSR